jgi:DHA2 family metal-tetracycline-proton antiporter-like MFS transporter
VGFLAMLANLTALVLTPLLLIGENGLPPGAAGLALTPGAVALALLAPLSGRLSDRIGVRTPIVAGLSVMVLSAFFISTLAAGASAVMVSVGILGLMTGMAFVQSPLTNAAAGSLPDEEMGGGMGIFQGLLFLGGGTGPALIGAFLAAREEAGFSAINPLYALNTAPFSDAFLAIALVLVLALMAASALRDGSRANKQDERSGKEKAR